MRFEKKKKIFFFQSFGQKRKVIFRRENKTSDSFALLFGAAAWWRHVWETPKKGMCGPRVYAQPRRHVASLTWLKF